MFGEKVFASDVFHLTEKLAAAEAGLRKQQKVVCDLERQLREVQSYIRKLLPVDRHRPVAVGTFEESTSVAVVWLRESDGEPELRIVDPVVLE